MMFQNFYRHLTNKLKTMQSFLTEILNKNKKTSTAVLFVSFLITFCVYPYMNIDDTEEIKKNVLSQVPYKGNT